MVNGKNNRCIKDCYYYSSFCHSTPISLKDSRTAGSILLPDGKTFDAELLKARLAWYYKYADRSEEFAALENYARNITLKIWSMKDLIAPSDFRQKTYGTNEGAILDGPTRKHLNM